MRRQDRQSRVLYELCVLIFTVLRSPPMPNLPPVLFPTRPPEISPVGLTLLFLGISMSLILCGSITFLIGFLLMPWILALALVFHLVGIISNLANSNPNCQSFK